ncbi:hypothetical protein BLNAU_780 [Blattamonas nauphoetae]|uniref:C2H2-type domain-containing protein n=1 Tax=Blattamonas nauphoetae TaxID=2049346 RepID=A0ABQ9YL16_9EUKA|nr:hypothetical protein BLNAU_780 [Blattamonas nauphoetae]
MVTQAPPELTRQERSPEDKEASQVEVSQESSQSSGLIVEDVFQPQPQVLQPQQTAANQGRERRCSFCHKTFSRFYRVNRYEKTSRRNPSSKYAQAQKLRRQSNGDEKKQAKKSQKPMMKLIVIPENDSTKPFSSFNFFPLPYSHVCPSVFFKSR